jgi:hypothetical protein
LDDAITKFCVPRAPFGASQIDSFLYAKHHLTSGAPGACLNSGSAGTFSVTGSISPASDGNGATVALSGPVSLTTTGNSSGNYSFSGLTNGIYTVTPSRTGYAFTPSVGNFSINGASVSGLNFTAAQASTHTVQLSWAASTSNVSGYNVYRGTSNGGPYSKVNGAPVTGLSYTDSSVAASTTYYYVTTAVDSEGVESIYSNQASAVIP